MIVLGMSASLIAIITLIAITVLLNIDFERKNSAIPIF